MELPTSADFSEDEEESYTVSSGQASKKQHGKIKSKQLDKTTLPWPTDKHRWQSKTVVGLDFNSPTRHQHQLQMERSPYDEEKLERYFSLMVHPKGRMFHQGDIILILFDLNGVLVHHTFENFRRHYTMRPGLQYLRRLFPRFRLGIYSSATKKTVVRALISLNDEIMKIHDDEYDSGLNKTIVHGDDVEGFVAKGMDDRKSIFEVIFCRDHCFLAKDVGLHRPDGKEWDTVKPLGSYFEDLSRVILVDDSPHKSMPGEKSNMLIIPTWEGPSPTAGKDCHVLKTLVDMLLYHGKFSSGNSEKNITERSTQTTQPSTRSANKPGLSNIVDVRDFVPIISRHFTRRDQSPSVDELPSSLYALSL